MAKSARQAVRKQLVQFRKPRRTVTRVDLDGLMKEYRIPTTLSEEQRAACDAVGLEMKYKSSEAEFGGVVNNRNNPNWEGAIHSDEGKLKAIKIEITDEQVGKKFGKHALDYKLPFSKEGLESYKKLTNKILFNPHEIRSGIWKTLGKCDFYISERNVAIVKDGRWISTFPLTNQGTFDYIMSLPLK